MPLATPAPQLVPLVERVHASLTGKSPRRAPHVSFYPYVEGKSTVRELLGRLEFKLNAGLLGAPDEVLEGIITILLSRIQRIPESRLDPRPIRAYREYNTEREGRGPPRSRKHIDPVGAHRSLVESFLRVTLDMDMLLPIVPTLSWSKTVSRRRLGHWDADHKAVVISQVLDDPKVPEFVLDYVVYHELLHIMHPVKMGSGTKRRVHTATFKRDERKFPAWKEAEAWLMKLSR